MLLPVVSFSGSAISNSVAAKGKCNAVMLGVNVAPICHSDRALNLWLQYL